MLKYKKNRKANLTETENETKGNENQTKPNGNRDWLFRFRFRPARNCYGPIIINSVHLRMKLINGKLTWSIGIMMKLPPPQLSVTIARN